MKRSGRNLRRAQSADAFRQVKKVIQIPKSRITAPVDFGKIIAEKSACGVNLSYTEYDFLQLDSGKIVMFDGYSGVHKYAPFNVECGMIAFPFFCGCMTDSGERVAYAGLRFSEDKAVEWKPLIDKSALIRLATQQQAGGIPVPSGVCCFSDEQGYELYFSHIRDEVQPLAGMIVLDGQTHAVVNLYGKRYAVFSAGWGDGRYNCYAGYSKAGKVTAVIADFGMIDYGKRDDTPVDVEVETDDENLFVYDPNKSEAENNIERWTMVIENASAPEEKLRAYSRRGYAYHYIEDTAHALSDYMAAVECSKNVKGHSEVLAWSVYDNAAEIFIARSDYESAIKLMTDALDVNDTFYAGAFVRLIDLYQTVKRADKALAIAERMVASRPDDPVSYMKYAECCVSVMDYNAAAEAYDLLVTRFDLYESLFDEASCYIELGENDKAVASLNRHPAKENYEQYWYYLAYIEYKSHRLRKSLEFAEKSYSLDSTYMPALYLLIDIESQLNEYYAVARYAEEYKKLRPDNEFGYSVCAEAHLVLGNFSECARNYCHIYQNIKNDDKYAALAAVACAWVGDKKRSASLLKKLKRKKSPYYAAAMFTVIIRKTPNRDVIFNPSFYSNGDYDEYLLTLTLFLYKIDDVLHSARLLDLLYKSDNLPFEVVAMQIRLAERIGNKKHFLYFLNYYVDNFISASATVDERSAIAKSFILDSAHRAWLSELRIKN